MKQVVERERAEEKQRRGEDGERGGGNKKMETSIHGEKRRGEDRESQKTEKDQ